MLVPCLSCVLKCKFKSILDFALCGSNVLLANTTLLYCVFCFFAYIWYVDILYLHIICKNYTSVDPKQFTVNKFRLKPVILISECVCSRCGHTNQHPPPTWRETTGDNGRQDHFRATPTNTHPPHEGRQPETTGDKTTSEPKKPTTPTNTKVARSKVAWRTPTVNCLGKKQKHMPCMCFLAYIHLKHVRA